MNECALGECETELYKGKYMTNVKLVWLTPDAEKHIAYCARVSNPKNQDNTDIEGLIRYCAKHHHWSIFEMVSMCVEVTTTRDISAQMIRHRSFSFQEFSQRYAESTNIPKANPRRQDKKNRQNSIDDVDADVKGWWLNKQHRLNQDCLKTYREALDKGIAKECARKILPINTETKLYMSGTIRSFIHYLNVRTDPSTQLEHREVAEKIKEIFAKHLPVTYNSINN